MVLEEIAGAFVLEFAKVVAAHLANGTMEDDGGYPDQTEQTAKAENLQDARTESPSVESGSPPSSSVLPTPTGEPLKPFQDSSELIKFVTDIHARIDLPNGTTKVADALRKDMGYQKVTDVPCERWSELKEKLSVLA